jgi:acyl-CoA thioester hydrolase
VTPRIYRSQHRVAFSELDPYNHMGTAAYARLFVDHRMAALRDTVGWSHDVIGQLPFLLWVRRLEIDFVRPAIGDLELALASFVREFRGADAIIDCTMSDRSGKLIAQCVMTVAHVDRAAKRATDWPVDVTVLFTCS